MKQTQNATLMIVALLTFSVFGFMSGILSVTQAAEGQPAQSEETPPNEKTAFSAMDGFEGKWAQAIGKKNVDRK
jgi:hypothetical protein